MLRQQLLVLRRKCRGRVRLTNGDRLLFVQLYRWFPSVLQVLHILRPGDARALAPSRFSQLLAMEVPGPGRASLRSTGTCGR